ncbi:hypothetical protein AMELA_G00102570 [Ameiurus melas]|uniref:Uncharacterized protein n=1 Tax=Ameiurus melas TaxID=219545 RepID=A0A7J6AVF5_AMEME|nr:hypothetical protein AMELA_G00102570 [Ameiurus melas]
MQFSPDRSEPKRAFGRSDTWGGEKETLSRDAFGWCWARSTGLVTELYHGCVVRSGGQKDTPTRSST